MIDPNDKHTKNAFSEGSAVLRSGRPKSSPMSRREQIASAQRKFVKKQRVSGGKRLQIYLPERDSDRLKQIKEAHGLKNLSEVVGLLVSAYSTKDSDRKYR